MGWKAAATTCVGVPVPAMVNALAAGGSPLASSASSKVRVSVVPLTTAPASTGGVSSGVRLATFLLAKLAAALPSMSTSWVSLGGGAV